MIIKYPLFMKDREGWMYLLFSEKDINDYLEPVDIEDKEYDGWDIEGRPVELFMEDKRIKAKYISEDRDLDAIKAAILHYADIGTEVPFEYEETEMDPLELFNEAKEHIKIHKKRLIKRIKTKLLNAFRELKEGIYWALANLLFIAISFLLDVKSWDVKYGVTWVFGGVIILFAWLNIIIFKLARKIIRRRNFGFQNIIGLIFFALLIIFGWFGIFMSLSFLLILWIPD